jgi:hypothetical protein
MMKSAAGRIGQARRENHQTLTISGTEAMLTGDKDL